VFLRVYRGLPYFRADARLSTWIFRIVSNIIAEERKPGLRTISLDEPLPGDDVSRFDPGGIERAYGDLELRAPRAAATRTPAYRADRRLGLQRGGRDRRRAGRHGHRRADLRVRSGGGEPRSVRAARYDEQRRGGAVAEQARTFVFAALLLTLTLGVWWWIEQDVAT
jgi:hypothetical protein